MTGIAVTFWIAIAAIITEVPKQAKTLTLLTECGATEEMEYFMTTANDSTTHMYTHTQFSDVTHMTTEQDSYEMTESSETNSNEFSE